MKTKVCHLFSSLLMGIVLIFSSLLVFGLMPGQSLADGPPSLGAVPQIPYDVAAILDGSAESNIPLLKAGEGGKISGQVLLPNGNPAPNSWVAAISFNYLMYKVENTDQNGNFQIEGLVTGTWRLRAFPPTDPAFNAFAESLERLAPISATSIITLSSPLTLTTANLVGRAVFPDGVPAGESGVDIFKPDFSFQRRTVADSQGYFKANLSAGDYLVKISPPWNAPGFLSPPPVSFTIPSAPLTQPVHLGPITFTQATKHIAGQVVRTDGVSRSENGTGVPNVQVQAWRRGADGWAGAKTDANGNFKLDVAPGDWEVMIHPGANASADWMYQGHPKLIKFELAVTQPETKTVNFNVVTAKAKVIGQIEGPNGEELAPWGAWVNARNPDGIGNVAPLSTGSRFTVPLTLGNYNIWVGVDKTAYPNWSGQRLAPIVITDEQQTLDLGTIRLLEKTATIKGQVSNQKTGAGIAAVPVHAWQPEGGWASTTTDAGGRYQMRVISGSWEVNVALPPNSTFVSGQPPKRVVVTDTRTVNFALREADGAILGKLENAEGQLLSDVEGWAYAREAPSPEPIASAPIESGEFSLNVPSGVYQIGLWLPPNSGYTFQGEESMSIQRLKQRVAQAKTPADVAIANMSAREQQAFVQAGTPYSITFMLLPNDATIRTLFKKTDGSPALGLEGTAFAWGGVGGAWQAAPINPQTGVAEIAVAAGTGSGATYNVGYSLDSPDYINNPPPETRVTVTSTDVFTLPFTLIEANASINGVILDPDGNPFNYAWAWAHRPRVENESAAIDTGAESRPPNGEFNIRVTSAGGNKYFVGAYAPEHLGYIQPDVQVVTLTNGTGTFPLPTALQFKRSDATITGTVYLNNLTGQRVIGPEAWVWAWSEDGQHTGSRVDAQGHYRLNVISGTIWWVGAVYQVEQSSLFYETRWPPTRVPMTATNQGRTDLDLYLAGTALPPAIGATFAANIGWTGILSDGTVIYIPAGVIPTSNPTDTVRISVTPLVEELPNTLTSRPFGFGYAITAFDEATGNQIVSNFNGNVLLIFNYTQDQLEEHGVTEEDLSPAFFSTTTNSWEKVQSYTVHPQTQQVAVQINHFSAWVLTAWGIDTSSLEETGYKVYLPLILMN